MKAKGWVKAVRPVSYVASSLVADSLGAADAKRATARQLTRSRIELRRIITPMY